MSTIGRITLMKLFLHTLMEKLTLLNDSFLTPLQQTTFENSVAKRKKNAHYVQFLLLPQCFQLY